MTISKTDTAALQSTEPSPSFLKRVEKATIETLGNLLGIQEKPRDKKLHRLTPEQAAQLLEIEENAIADFHGDLDQLESALGMLRLGHHVGWRVLYMIHSKRTIRNYEYILKIKIRDVFDAEGPSSYRSIGLNLANRFSNFWKVAGGDIKVPKRKEVVQ